jgi:hypothetical protein
VYDLVVAKNGRKFKEAAERTAPKEDAAHPARAPGPIPLEAGGYMPFGPGRPGMG